MFCTGTKNTETKIEKRTHSLTRSLTPAPSNVVHNCTFSFLSSSSQLLPSVDTHTHVCALLVHRHAQANTHTCVCARSRTYFDSHLNRSSIAEAQIKPISFHYCACDTTFYTYKTHNTIISRSVNNDDANDK